MERPVAMPTRLLQLSMFLRPHRWKLLATAIAGLAISLALIFTVPSAVGFALMGPSVVVPWGLMCAGSARSPLQASFFFSFTLLGAVWPLVVLLG